MSVSEKASEITRNSRMRTKLDALIERQKVGELVDESNEVKTTTNKVISSIQILDCEDGKSE